MTTLQSHSLTAIITATIAVAVTYFILTNGDTQPPPIDPETYRKELTDHAEVLGVTEG